MFKRFLLVALFAIVGCMEDDVSNASENSTSVSLFANVDAEADYENHSIEVGSPDSLIVGDLSSLGGKNFYLALDKDLEDPEIDWERVLDSGKIISLKDKDFVHIVALDGSNRVVAVWEILFSAPSKDLSCSSEVSSSSKVPESSNSLSSSFLESSSSQIAEESSSSEIESSSSGAAAIKASELSVENGIVSVEGSKVYVEIPYGSDLSKVKLNPLDSVYDLRRPLELSLVDDSGAEKSYHVVAGMQLPGSDFSQRNDFWATTSDAMSTDGVGTYTLLFIPISITMSSTANADFADGSMTLSTYSVTGRGAGFDGGWKMAGGFYYAGTFSGTDCASIYQASNSSAAADNSPADFSQYMTHGKPFEARPVAFEVRYKYDHRQNTNDTYLQKALVYVVLVSADYKIVAAGSLTEEASVDDWTSRKIELTYGSDAGLLEAGYAGLSDLSVGTGEEDVASIRVMFASSAFAYVADGGTSSQMKKKFRGGEKSAFTLDEFKLIY